jgi:hypothetical protein
MATTEPSGKENGELVVIQSRNSTRATGLDLTTNDTGGNQRSRPCEASVSLAQRR